MIPRNIHETFSYLTVDSNFYVACSINDVSRVSLSGFFCASFWCDCGVVRYHKSRRATIFSRQTHPQTHPRRAQITPPDTPQPTNLLHSLLLTMPCTIIPHVPINSEWAEILIGLRLNIRNKLRVSKNGTGPIFVFLAYLT